MDMSAQPSFRVHIASLVVNGLGTVARGPLARAVEAELSRLLAAGGGNAAAFPSGHRPRVDGGAFTMAAHPRAAELGTQIGAAVHRGMVSP